MLLYSTILDINSGMTKEDFVNLVIEWNQTSSYKNNIIHGIKWEGNYSVRYGDDDLWLAAEEYRKRNIIAVRYEKADEGCVWDTDFIMNFDAYKMSVRLDRSYTRGNFSDRSCFAVPRFITMLENKGYLKNDGELPVTSTPIQISEENCSFISDIVNGKAEYKLPVVYVSRTSYETDPVDVYKLAERLKGAAHVLVQKSTSTNSVLCAMCESKNEYNGAIGIYYPDQSFSHRRCFYRMTGEYDNHLTEKVVREVIRFCNSQRVDLLYTWLGVNNAVLRDRLAAEVRTEEDTISDGSENELRDLQKQIHDLRAANELLQAENHSLKDKLNLINSIPVLSVGRELELYPGEMKGMILLELSESVSGIDVNDPPFEPGKRLKSRTGMTDSLRQALENMGFWIAEDGEYYKLTYFGDYGNKVIISKTPV